MKKNIITAINTAIISFNFMKLKDVVALCILSLCATFASAQLSVTINAPNTTISCSNFGVSMTAIVTGGTAPFTYSWSSGCSNTASCIPTGNSNYTVTVTDATGQNTATNSVAITYNIISPIVQMQATSDTISCATPIVQLTASCTNVTNLTYAWANTSQTTQTIDVYTPGTYTVNATNTQNGCTASANYIVISDGTSPPNLRIVKTNDIDCSHAAAVYSAQSADSYLWSNGATTPTLTTTVAGLYTVTCTVGGYACAPSFTVTVAYDTVKPIIVMQSSGDLHCVGSYTLLYSSCTNCNFPGGMGYSWGGGTQQNTSSDMYVYQPGIYTVSAAAPNGCIGSASITVVRDTTPPT